MIGFFVGSHLLQIFAKDMPIHSWPCYLYDSLNTLITKNSERHSSRTNFCPKLGTYYSYLNPGVLEIFEILFSHSNIFQGYFL